MNVSFDFFSWVVGYGLAAVTDNLRRGRKSLVDEINLAVADWAKDLPSDRRLGHPDALFPRAVPDGDERPQLRVVREQLAQKRLPTQMEWHRALIEQWQFVRRAVGAEAQPFFLLDEEEARSCLYPLASRICEICQQNESIFRSEVLGQLEQLSLQAGSCLPVLVPGGPDLKSLCSAVERVSKLRCWGATYDAAYQTITCWVELTTTPASSRFRYDIYSAGVLFASRVDARYLRLMPVLVRDLPHSDGRGKINTFMLLFELNVARQRAGTRFISEYWDSLTLLILENDNTPVMRWLPAPLSRLEVMP